MKINSTMFAGPHTLSVPWNYQLGSAGMEMSGCSTKLVPDDDGNDEVNAC